MRDVTIRALDERDRELIEALERVGMNRNAAKIITYLASVPEVTSRDLEAECDLRQPEVSVAMHALKEHNWVKDAEIKAKGKSRPTKIYSLSVSIDEVIRYYEEQIIRRSSQTMESIQRLRGLAIS